MAEDNIEISIIIPNYNSSKFIVETIDSIKKQTFYNWECIIIDDGSLDDSVKIIKQNIQNDQRFKLYNRPENVIKGANACRNYGLEKSFGKYINWFDSDDVMSPNFLEVKMKNILGKDFVIATGSFANYNLDPNKNKKIELFQSDFIYKDYVLWKLKILTPSLLFRKNFLMINNYLFNEKIFKGQEMELFSRIFFACNKSQYSIINESTFLYRSHENSSTARNQGYNKKFKKSETYCLLENFKRVLQIKEDDLIQSFSRGLINMLKKSVDNDDADNVINIMDNLKLLIAEKNKIRFLLLHFITSFFLLTKIKWLRWDYPFKKLKISY